jgi:hypothetical protein
MIANAKMPSAAPNIATGKTRSGQARVDFLISNGNQIAGRQVFC